MNFVLRPFAGYLLLIAIAAYFGSQIAEGELKPAMRQAVEELLIDNANLLAEIAASANALAGAEQLTQAYARFEQRRFDARIYGVAKTRPDLRLYLTDAKGQVRFDSVRTNIGNDFSAWNDVLRTLRGQYGARATRTDANNPASSVLYVAAPVHVQGQISGVLTLGKSSLSFEPFLAAARASILRAGGTLVAAAVLLALLLSWWMSRDLQRLSQYARDASAGKRVAAPRYRGGELATLSAALSSMRAQLEGKAHVEHFAQLLTHELKSPLAAIAGAAELLDEDMNAADRRTFVANIRAQTAHMQSLVERLAQLTVLESRAALTNAESLPVRALIDTTTSSRAQALADKQLRIEVRTAPAATLYGERVLLQLALASLLDNAIAFSTAGSHIEISHQRDDAFDRLRVRDHGTGLPDYALDRVFERFYSLPRPDTGAKSTGLGLPLVREVAALHGGTVEVRNHPAGGAEVCLSIARSTHERST